MLVYDEQHPEDEYGGLSLVPLDVDDFAEFEVNAATFQREAGNRSRRMA